MTSKLTIAFALLLLVGGVAHAELRPAYGGRARLPLSDAPVVDPLVATDSARQVSRLVFDTLFDCATGSPEPHLALALTGDGQRVTLQLRGDTVLHDERVLTAVDVAASLTRALRSASSATFVLGPIAAARAVAPDRVELQLTRPTPELAQLLCAPASAIAVMAKNGRTLIGTGPFSVAEIDARHVVLRAFAHHFAGRPYLDELIGRQVASRAEEAGGYELGLYEVSRQGASAFAGGRPKHPFVVVDSDAGATSFLAVSSAIPAATRATLSAALAALDRRRLARSTTPNLTIVDDAPAAAVPVTNARPTAKLLIDSSRFEDGALDDRLLAELARVGIDATVERAAPRDFVDRLATGRFELALATVAAPITDLALAAVSASVDPSGARARLAHAASSSAGPPAKLDGVVLFGRRAVRLWHDEALQLTALPDGTADWANAYFLPASTLSAKTAH